MCERRLPPSVTEDRCYNKIHMGVKQYLHFPIYIAGIVVAIDMMTAESMTSTMKTPFFPFA